MDSGTKRIPVSLYFVMGCRFAIGGAVVPFITLLLRDRGLDVGRISQVFLACSGTLLVFPFFWGTLADRYLPMNRLFALINLLGVLALWTVVGQGSFTGLLVSFTAFYACFPFFGVGLVVAADVLFTPVS